VAFVGDFMVRVLIISPHNDDALIGCFLYLTNKLKINGVSFSEAENYILFGGEELDSDRMKEAVLFAEDFNLKLVTSTYMVLSNLDFDIVIAPSPESKHYYHKYLAWKSLDVKAKCRVFYSIDMEEWWVRPLPVDLRRVKKELLDKYFPLEKSLWDSDAKYYIFEGYVYFVGW
jgi:hypothetical protein